MIMIPKWIFRKSGKEYVKKKKINTNLVNDMVYIISYINRSCPFDGA